MVVLVEVAVSYERGTPVREKTRLIKPVQALRGEQVQGYLAHKKQPPPRILQ